MQRMWCSIPSVSFLTQLNKARIEPFTAPEEMHVTMGEVRVYAQRYPSIA